MKSSSHGRALYLSAVGANIEQLNTVRKQLSRIKGGGLMRACRAGRLVSLIISDVLGDPLEVIASGPTVEDTSTPRAALDRAAVLLERYRQPVLAEVWDGRRWTRSVSRGGAGTEARPE